MRANWRRINDVIVDALRAVTLTDLQMSVMPSASKPVRGHIPVQLMSGR